MGGDSRRPEPGKRKNTEREIHKSMLKNKGGVNMLKKRNQKGFTLIEIIAVLVILGILAAVAIPKYFDMQNEAKNKAASGAVAQGKGMLSMAWGKAAMSFGSSPAMTAVNAQMPTFSTAAGEFSLAYATAAAGASITASGTIGGASGGTATGTWPLP
jgi:MSHA pilin protein MshA